MRESTVTSFALGIQQAPASIPKSLPPCLTVSQAQSLRFHAFVVAFGIMRALSGSAQHPRVCAVIWPNPLGLSHTFGSLGMVGCSILSRVASSMPYRCITHAAPASLHSLMGFMLRSATDIGVSDAGLGTQHSSPACIPKTSRCRLAASHAHWLRVRRNVSRSGIMRSAS